MLNYKLSCFYLIVNKMKLLLNGKKRSIYFRKNNTAYYKSKGSEIDITNYFKKKGGLKKQYSNLLVEKKLVGGVHREISFNSNEIFNNPIRIKKSNIGDFTSSNKQWDIQTIRDIYKKMLYVFLICKINLKVNGELFKNDFKDRKKLNATIKIKKILSILNGNTFELYNIDGYNINRFSPVKYNPCFKKFIELKLTDDAIFDYNPNKINIFTIDDNYYVTLLNYVTFKLINEKIKFINSFDFKIIPEIKFDYKYALRNDVSVSKNTNLDLLKIIMINEGLFDTLNTDDAIDDIKKSTPNYCDLDKILKEYKEKYLKIFHINKINKINEITTDIDLNAIIETLNIEIEKDIQLTNKFDAIWDKHINEINEVNEVNDNINIYSSEYNNKYYIIRTRNAVTKENELNALMEIIKNLESGKIANSTKQHSLDEIERIKTDYFIPITNNKKSLSIAYNPLIKYYIDQITENIGRVLTTYLSVRPTDSLTEQSKISDINDLADTKKSIKFDNVIYSGFNRIFGTIGDTKKITQKFNNTQKFDAMIPLFDKLKTSELAILLFGYGYSGSGKTYTLFGGNPSNNRNTFEDGIAQHVISHFSDSEVEITGIYELYNDTYNILNAIKADRDPYDPYTSIDAMDTHISNMSQTYKKMARDQNNAIFLKPEDVYLHFDTHTKAGLRMDDMPFSRSRPRPNSAAPSRPTSAAPSRPTSAFERHITAAQSNNYTRNYLEDREFYSGPRGTHGGMPITPSNSFYYYYQSNNDILMSPLPVSYKLIKAQTNTFDISINGRVAKDKFTEIYNKIEKLRKENKHIMATANNQFSSRGHLFIDFRITTKKENEDSIISYLTICDMGGRENPNDLLLETKIFNILEKEAGGDYGKDTDFVNNIKKSGLVVDRPYIISKDEDRIYTFDVEEHKVTTQVLKDILNKIKNKIPSVINDNYPGILQLYKSFYSRPSLLEYFYYSNKSTLDLSHPIGTHNSSYIKGLFSNMGPSGNIHLVDFYINFFKCIKQGFYINDSINQLLRKFGSDENVEYNVKKVVNNTPELSDYKGKKTKNCDLDNLTLITQKTKTDEYNKYGWYTSVLPIECVKAVDFYKSNVKLINPKINSFQHYQYNPNKITDASDLSNTNIGIAEVYNSFGKARENIMKKYVVIGCIRDSENFKADDKLTLSFLENVSTSKLTADIVTEVQAAEAGTGDIEEDEDEDEYIDDDDEDEEDDDAGEGY